MRLPWTLGATLFLMTLALSGQSPAAETTSSHLRALAARQDLYDMVCYAKANGSIGCTERAVILMDAKDILSPEEYLKFKKALDRISPPPKPSPNQLAKATRKKLALRTLQQPLQPAEPATGPVIPAGAALPDQMAPPAFSR
jgi:hypothetical protein